MTSAALASSAVCFPRAWPALTSRRGVVCWRLQALAQELGKVCDGTSVSVKQGRIEVKGHYRAEVKEYLLGLGF